MDLWKMSVQGGDDSAIPLVGSLMMQSTDDMHFRATVIRRFLATCDDLLVRHRITLGVTQIATERTEPAAIDADVGRIQMRVDVEVADVAIHSLANLVCQLAKFLQRHVGLVHEQTIVQR